MGQSMSSKPSAKAQKNSPSTARSSKGIGSSTYQEKRSVLKQGKQEEVKELVPENIQKEPPKPYPRLNRVKSNLAEMKMSEPSSMKYINKSKIPRPINTEGSEEYSLSYEIYQEPSPTVRKMMQLVLEEMVEKSGSSGIKKPGSLKSRNDMEKNHESEDFFLLDDHKKKCKKQPNLSPTMKKERPNLQGILNVPVSSGKNLAISKCKEKVIDSKLEGQGEKTSEYSTAFKCQQRKAKSAAPKPKKEVTFEIGSTLQSDTFEYSLTPSISSSQLKRPEVGKSKIPIPIRMITANEQPLKQQDSFSIRMGEDPTSLPSTLQNIKPHEIYEKQN